MNHDKSRLKGGKPPALPFCIFELFRTLVIPRVPHGFDFWHKFVMKNPEMYQCSPIDFSEMLK